VTDLLQECQRAVPWDCLRAVLLRLSGGARGFLEARARYSATLAAVSAAGYVAGVGDRHLQNFLMDTGTGGSCCARGCMRCTKETSPLVPSPFTRQAPRCAMVLRR
jgi:hypothetical protein